MALVTDFATVMALLLTEVGVQGTSGAGTSNIGAPLRQGQGDMVRHRLN